MVPLKAIGRDSMAIEQKDPFLFFTDLPELAGGPLWKMGY